MLRLFNPRRKKLTLNRFLQLGLFLPVIWLIVGNTQEIRYAAMDTWNKIQMIMEQGVQITIRPRSVTPVAEPPLVWKWFILPGLPPIRKYPANEEPM